MNFKHRLHVITAVVGLGVSQPSVAGCCNDFLSCAAAVATGGVSCVVEAARQDITNFVTRVRSAIDNGKRELDATAARLQGDVDRALQTAEHRFTNETRKIEAALQSVAGARGAPASPEYTRGVQRLQELANEARQRQPNMVESLRQGRAASVAGRDRMRQTFEGVFLTPLSGLIAPLIVAVDPITAAATIAILGPQVDNILRNTEQRITADINGFRNQVEPRVAEADRLAEEVAQRAQAAQSLQSALQNMAQAPTAANLATLQNISGKNATFAGNRAVRQAAPGASSVALTASFQSVNASLLPTLRAGLQDTATVARATKPKGPSAAIDTASYQNRARSELDRMMAGKSPAAAQQETNRLLAEARTRYASDPATLQKLEKYLTEQTLVREVRNPAPAAKTAREVRNLPPAVKTAPEPAGATPFLRR